MPSAARYSLLSVIVPGVQRAGHGGRGDPAHPGGRAPRGRRGDRGRRRVVRRHRQGAGRRRATRPSGSSPTSSNRGKGAAVRTGLEAVRGDLVLVQDADLEYDPDDWPQLLDPILRGKAQVVYGSRFTGERKNMMPLHWIGNRFLSLVTNVLYSSTLSDMETCYKLFDRRVLEGIAIESDSFEFEPEITAKVLRRGYRIYEVPISYAGREIDEGKKITWRDGFGALKALDQVPVHPRRAVTAARPEPAGGGRERARWPWSIVNYESGPPSAAAASGSAARARPRWWWWTTAPRTARSALARADFPDVAVVVPGRQPRLRVGRQPGSGRHHRAVRAGGQPRSRGAPGCRSPHWPGCSTTSPAAAWSGRSIRTPGGGRYPSARRFPSLVDAAGHAVLGIVWPRQPLHPRLSALGPRRRRRRGP